MSLRKKLSQDSQVSSNKILEYFGVLNNPFPTSNQNSDNPHYPIPEDENAENRILTFIRDSKSDVLVVLGTQGVGKTNILNYLEDEIRNAKADLDGYYIVKYMADPESTFDGTIRTIFQELGTEHLKRIATALSRSNEPLSDVRSYDLRQALLTLSKDIEDDENFDLCLEWLFGLRIFNIHKYSLGINFRLDTLESRTAVLRDYILLSKKLGELKGIILLLDELEKQDGVLGPRAVVRYLSGLRAIIDALPSYLFMIIAITPDAMRRYSSALPAFRSRLENHITLNPLESVEEAQNLANFYVNEAYSAARVPNNERIDKLPIITEQEVKSAFYKLDERARVRGDNGVRQREILNKLHDIVENKLQLLF